MADDKPSVVYRLTVPRFHDAVHVNVGMRMLLSEGRMTCGCPDPWSFYVCAGCRRVCGWCFGAADDAPDLCDDCWHDSQR